ncbi:MAG TPA: biosynthetic peptidoglycan transglycosylase, partial [Candidatus Sulfotelmatobacter sp.]|nr:biosynthetic peptidoglycan transglycosylase [Candidatus Sulfotelmatobacter sp.]
MNRPPRWTGVGGPSSRLGRRARRRRAGLQPAGEPVAGGRGRWSRLSPTWRRVIKISLAAIALLSGILGGMVAYAALTLPDVGDIGKLTGTIKIVDRNGKPLAEVGRDRVSRSPVSLANVSQPMQDATIAAEDRNFYEEGAFNAGRVLKALFVDVILRQPAQGASTITQQLAKQAFFGASAEKSPLRKLREALLANEINARLSKTEILEKYLNITYYGENAYGVQNAAKRYFNKDAKSLDLREATMLAGLPQAPSFYDPYKNPQGSYLRQHYVLSGLVETGKVSQAEADAVDPFVGGESATPEQQSAQQRNQQDLAADLSRGRPLLTGVAPHFVQYVQDQLDQPPYNLDSEQINGDLTVTTTLDLDTQNKANTSVHDGIAGRD